jgi:hypothetical protein
MLRLGGQYDGPRTVLASKLLLELARLVVTAPLEPCSDGPLALSVWLIVSDHGMEEESKRDTKKNMKK